MVYQAKEILTAHIGAALENELKAYYEQSGEGHIEYTPFPSDMGHRSLMNLCLDYLVNARGCDYTILAERQFNRQQNYNDTLQALSVLVSSGNKEASVAALALMYEKYNDNNLVMNDWLAVQAQSGTIDDINELARSMVFSFENPNKIHSLFGVFASRNIPGFHKADGSGYRFLADQIIKIDGINSKCAEVLLGEFTKASEYDVKRREQMVVQVERRLTKQQL